MRPLVAACATVALVLLASTAPAGAVALNGALSPLQHDHGSSPPPPSASAATTAAQTPDSEIDRLLAAMNAAQGDAKVAVMADLIARLVAERRPASTEARGCSMCAAKMAPKAAATTAAPSPEQPSAKDDAAARPGCAMMAKK